ncbi:sulfurtransferase [Tomitella gaofuii]|uniref:sulfurtransferase n=1 Tax=Tomitella gaofuii TaxID=2760083 RepID=UPI0015FD8CCA|nr:sulfurtransferase [Tomitella gaofuii]
MTGHASPLVDARELRDLLASPTPPVLLDVRWALSTGPDRGGFDDGHIPGARFVDLDAELAGPPGPGGRHPLPSAAAFAEAMRAAGIGATSTVVVYDAGPATAAARAWWLLRHHGHADVRVLDGGLARWVAEGLPLDSSDGGTHDDVSPARGDFRCGAVPPEGPGSVLDADDVLGCAARGVLIDARAPERFRGDAEPVDPVAGHIPGAVNRPTTANVRDDGTFLPADALRRQFDAIIGGIGGRPDEVAAYCGSGITAAHEVLALRIAGIPARLYPGSWSHWITDPARPVATGDG